MKIPMLGITPTRGFLIGIGGNTVQMLGTYWDLWWHLNLGRESFWIPPHEVVLVGMAILVFGVGFGFLADRQRQQKNGRPRITLGYWLVGVGVVCMLLAAYLDDLRHRALAVTGGKDAIITPTHLFLFGSGFTVGLGIMFGLARELHLRGVWPRSGGGKLAPLRGSTAEEKGLYVQFADWIMILMLLSWDYTDHPWSVGTPLAALLSSSIFTLVLVTALLTVRRFGTATVVSVIFTVMRAPFGWASFYYPVLIIAAVLLDLVAARYALTNSVVKTSLVASLLLGPFLQTLYLAYLMGARSLNWTPEFELVVIAVSLGAGVATSLASRPLAFIVRSISF